MPRLAQSCQPLSLDPSHSNRSAVRKHRAAQIGDFPQWEYRTRTLGFFPSVFVMTIDTGPRIQPSTKSLYSTRGTRLHRSSVHCTMYFRCLWPTRNTSSGIHYSEPASEIIVCRSGFCPTAATKVLARSPNPTAARHKGQVRLCSSHSARHREPKWWAQESWTASQ